MVQVIGLTVSREWIYQYVAEDKASGGELYRHLRQGKFRYRKGYGQKRGRITDAVSIEQRPGVALLMSEVVRGTGRLTLYLVNREPVLSSHWQCERAVFT